MIAVATWADPSDQGDRLDRVFFWCFVIFSVGLAQLFFLFVALAITGKIDLPGVFKDKHAGTGDDKTVSLSRLQAFLWTLVGLSIYFHEAATSKNGIPPIPAELLLAMGISNGVYLASKHMGQNATRDQRGGDK